MNSIIYEQYKPWEVALATIEIARSLSGIKTQNLKLHQLLHSNTTEIKKCSLEIYKELKDDKAKAIKDLAVEETVLNEILKVLDIHQTSV
tara:strand:+ start:822 stop:1091 length:270 start_codon:yes stop_codon:yes gene_type:complete